MFKIVGRRVGLVLMVVVILSALVVPAASAGTQAGPTERSSGSQLSASSAGGKGCCSKTIIVRRGDTLTKIAYRYGTTVNALMRCNNIWNPDKIYAGQRLCICYPSGCRPHKPKPCPQPIPQPRLAAR